MSYLNTDVPELKGYDTGTVLSNVELLESRLESTLEAALCQLSELADAILRDAASDHDTVCSILLSLRGQQGEEENPPLRSPDLLRQNLAPLRGMTKHLGLYERLFLYRLILKKLPTLPVFGAENTELLLPSTAKGRIAYMSGALADKAYMRFASAIPQCRAAVFHSFVDACEEVRGGLCQYCILPLENSSEGTLMGFLKLIIKYHLQIIAVCDVRTVGGASEGTTRFGLLRLAAEESKTSGSPLADAHHPISCLELLHVTAIPSYSEIMAAADFCGLTLRRTDTLSAENTRTLFAEEQWSAEAPLTSPLISTVWQVDSGELSVFMLFLALEAPEDPLLGLYPVI